MRRSALVLVLVLVGAVRGQSVKLPKEVSVAPGRLAAIAIEWEGEDVRWDVPPELDVFREYDPDPKRVRLRVTGTTPGRFRLLAIAAKAGKLSDFAACQVMIGTPPVPPPGPAPPGPVPPGPVPPGPTPGPVMGLRVLMVYESADLSKYPPGQHAILYSQTVRDTLNSKCVVGPDGKTKEWRIWDADVALAGVAQTWRDLMRRPRQSTPWVILAGDQGIVHEGPLPADVPAMLELLKRYAPGAPFRGGWLKPPPAGPTGCRVEVRTQPLPAGWARRELIRWQVDRALRRLER